MEKVKLLDFAKLSGALKQELTAEFPMITLYDGESADFSSLPLEEIEIVIGWDTEKGAQLLEKNQVNLKWVQSASAGVDRFPLAEFAERGIQLTNASGVQSVPITEHVLGLLLFDYRRLRHSLEDQQKRYWDPQDEKLGTLLKKKMLIVGTGHIGQTLGKAAQALGVKTYGINTTGRLVPGFDQCFPMTELTQVLSEMEIIVNILPLTDETYHLYNQTFFNHVKKGAAFINVGRGKSVATDDLIAAIRSGIISFAGLDVFEEEPLPTDSPLWEIEEVLITPHVAGHRPDYMEAVMAIFVTNLSSWLQTEKLSQNLVDLSRGY